MTLRDWVQETKRRYRTDPATRATADSIRALRMGAQRRLGSRLGTSIWEQDWEVLIVLDACRADLWADVAPEYGLPIGGTIYSNASCSIDWYRRNFATTDHDLGDVGLVTANPFADHSADHAQSAELSAPPLGHLRRLYETEWTAIGTEPPIETVPPERVTDHAIDAWRRREKLGISRLVVHYMQPHEPFIARPEWSYQDPDDHAVLKNLVSEGYQAGTSPWQEMVDSGSVSPEEFWPVYCENLRWVVDDIDSRLLANLASDSVVVTADHGNGLGEWGEWHHPPGAVGPAVRRVPCVAVSASDGMTVTPETGDEGHKRAVSDQLEALGYA